MINLSHYLKTDVKAARVQFLGSCDHIGLQIKTYAGKGTGTAADNEPIYADLTLVGSADAGSLIILAPAPGRSGFLASAVMVAFLREKLYLELPDHVACLIIHAVNPKGPIWPAFNIIQDNRPLPPAKEWDNQLLMNVDAQYAEHKKIGQQGVILNRPDIAELPLSALAAAGWDENVIDDIEKRFLQGRQQISLIDFKIADDLAQNAVGIKYGERSILGAMGNLQDRLGESLVRENFDQFPSAGLIDQAGRHANILQFNMGAEKATEQTNDLAIFSKILRSLFNLMPNADS